jgi:hypothetical protein
MRLTALGRPLLCSRSCRLPALDREPTMGYPPAASASASQWLGFLRRRVFTRSTREIALNTSVPPHTRRPVRPWVLASLLVCCTLGCGATGPAEAAWPPLAKKWYDRARASYRRADLEDAELAVQNALRLLPKREPVRVLAARVALAQLQYDRAIQLLAGIQSTDARAVRGRALWYANRTDRAADELERLLADPEVRDPWAAETIKLARRGRGRRPFRMSGGLLAVTEMPHVNSSSLVVPLELNGEAALALIATNVPEAVIDSSGGADPSWVSLRFADRVEVDDVPALTQDLSGVSRQLNAPIKMLLGVNLLRQLRPTFDFAGHQFVVRSFDPPPPPRATTIELGYMRGGGMVLRSAFGVEESAPSGALLVDTSMTFPLALDEGGWKKAGVSTSSLKPVPNAGQLKYGTIPLLKLGAFEVPEVPGVAGAPTADLEKALGIELDGFVGAGLLAAFRVTLTDGGRTMWLEDMPVGAPAASHWPQPAEGQQSEAGVSGTASGSPASGGAQVPAEPPREAPPASPETEESPR